MHYIQKDIQESIDVKKALLQDTYALQQIELMIEKVFECLKNNFRLWLCGNGGSAADAQHIAAELTGRFAKERKAFPAEALHTNSSYITAVANDYGYNQVYARMVEGVCQPNDILIVISTSGNAQNIVEAAKTAQAKGIYTIAWTGMGGGEVKKHSSICIEVPSKQTPRIQESHILFGHILCSEVEKRLCN